MSEAYDASPSLGDTQTAFDQTQAFTAHYAVEEDAGNDEGLGMQIRDEAEYEEEGEENNDLAAPDSEIPSSFASSAAGTRPQSSVLSPTDRFHLEHREMEMNGEVTERNEQQEFWPHSQSQSGSSIMQAANMSAQSYIPKRLVGYEYGDKEWQMKRTPNPLVDNHVYVRMGSNGIFSCRPNVVHFAGFRLGKTYTQRVEVLNVSNSVQRLHILNPMTKEFQVTFKKKGNIQAGMSESLTIHFTPSSEARYYHDAIRVNCLGENLIIPLHAYPVLNSKGVVFPSHIDMGQCCVGDRVTKRFEIVNEAPVQFEYAFTTNRGGGGGAAGGAAAANMSQSLGRSGSSLDGVNGGGYIGGLNSENAQDDFLVFPLRGIIPASGSAWVTVDYVPKRAITASMELKVHISQMGFVPFVSTIVGRALPKHVAIPIVDHEKLRREREAKARKQKAMMASNEFAQKSANRSRVTTAPMSTSSSVLSFHSNNHLSGTGRLDTPTRQLAASLTKALKSPSKPSTNK